MHFYFNRFGLLGCILVLTCLNGCATTGVLQWGRDEVSIESSTLRVKNVPTMPDGLYSVDIPANWSRDTIVEAADGIFEIAPPATLSLSPASQSAKPDAAKFREVKKSDVLKGVLPSREAGTDMGAYIDRLAGRNFRVHMLFDDATRHRWVRIGTVDIGPGTQWAIRRSTSYAALPGAVAVDVITLPVLVISRFIMEMAAKMGSFVSK